MGELSPSPVVPRLQSRRLLLACLCGLAVAGTTGCEDQTVRDLLIRAHEGDDMARGGVIVFFLQIDTLTQKNSSRDNHLQNWLSRTACAFGAD
jgi:hypothetical protein